MRKLLACTCPLAIVAAATAVHAETSITTKVTTPVKTSTVKAGAPDDIKIAAAGSVVPAAGTAVTIDSNHKVVNEGLVSITGANGAIGILANAGVSSGITNSGKIELIEDYTPTDGDKDGDMDGPFAQGSNRFGIRVAPGGTFTGNILNSGTINVEGNDSAGIAVDSRLAGSLTSSGTISIVGDRVVAIRAGEVTGDVKVSGTISAAGAGATGVSLTGDIGGALAIQGSIASTGYRSINAPADASKLDADDLLQGGAAVHVAGNVAKGILLDAPPADKVADDKDEDDDGVEDAKEGIANLTSHGAAPALLVGAAARDVTVGAVTGNAAGHGIVVNGTVTGRGVYAGVDATGLQLGGLGGAVTVAGGLTVNGGVGAISKANATALRIGGGATLPELRIAGTIRSEGGSTATAHSRAVAIQQGGSLAAIHNGGQILADTSGDGRATAIHDASGTLDLVENKGVIAARGVALSTGRAVAIDLAANGGGATLRQLAPAANAPAPSIVGNILFGSGGDRLEIAGGTVSGTVKFGAGGDHMELSGGGIFSGTADFGGDAGTLLLSGTSRFTGSLAGSSALAVNVTGGTLDLSGSTGVQLGSLAVGAQGILGVAIDAAAGTASLIDVAGAASFAQGAKLQLKLTSVSEAVGSYTVLKAGTLSGTAGLSTAAVGLPVFLKSSVSADEAAGEIDVVIARKTAAELSLNGSEARAWDGVFAVLDDDAAMTRAFLAMADADSLGTALQQMMPNHAGGVFETVTQGSRASARFLRDPGAPLADAGGWGFWLQQVAWGTSKDLGETAAYDISGWGAAGGAEVKLGGAGSAGLSLAYLSGEDANGSNDNNVRANQYELAGYWRGHWGGLSAWARGSAARIGFSGRRIFAAEAGGELVTRTALGDWDGELYSAAAGLAYEMRFGRLLLRPAASIDHYRLSEDSYVETGGGAAMNLTVDARKSDETAAEASLTAGYLIGGDAGEGSFLRAEIEGGRRQIVGGELGATTARYGAGTAFTLLPEQRTDGWLGKLRLMGGNEDFSLGAEAAAEEQDGRAAVSFRVALQVAM